MAVTTSPERLRAVFETVQMEEGQPFEQPQHRLFGRIRSSRPSSAAASQLPLPDYPTQVSLGAPATTGPLPRAECHRRCWRLYCLLEQHPRPAGIARRQPARPRLSSASLPPHSGGGFAGDCQRRGVQVNGLPVLALRSRRSIPSCRGELPSPTVAGFAVDGEELVLKSTA